MRNLLHDEYARPLTADDLAGAAGCSRYAAYRAFSGPSKLTGMSLLLDNSE
jgi:AraC-like DNA-binding protein